MTQLEIIAKLSHEFGTADFVKGGGGNTSCKSADTLWIKPSGTTLSEISPDKFVALERRKLAELYDGTPPQNSSEREKWVKNTMAAAVLPGLKGRASVETPLHDSFEAAYVVHTHCMLVNGMTCAKRGAAVCKEMFPDVLWIPYTDPGYILSMRVRKDMAEYKRQKGRQPDTVILENHGIFAVAEDAEGIREIHTKVLGALRKAYSAAKIPFELKQGTEPSAARALEMHAKLKATVGGGQAEFLKAGAPFLAANGAITPDHSVYGKSYFHDGEPSAESVNAFKAKYGYWPRTVVTKDGVFGIGPNETAARLALELAQDGALIRQFAEAFGGIQYLNDPARQFIENWEVESYRSKVMGG
jgi:rhamnose utilization protein RhaD (predicted bifunctional aldolase and dehydrogenase)